MKNCADYSIEPFDMSGWHRRQRALYAHWRGLPRGGKRLPARAAFDPFEIPETLGWLWLVDVHRAPFRLRCRLFGTLLARAVHEDITGQWMDERPLSDPQRPTNAARLRATALDGRATHARTPPILKHGEIWSSVESLLLPFATDGETPDIVLGVTTYYRADGSAV